MVMFPDFPLDLPDPPAIFPFDGGNSWSFFFLFPATGLRIKISTLIEPVVHLFEANFFLFIF